MKNTADLRFHAGMDRNAFAKGLKDGLPICMGYIPVSFTFGMMAIEKGLPVWIAMLISMSNFTSAGQFAGTALILSGGAYFEIAVTTFVINIRYMLMSLSLAQKVDSRMTLGQRSLLGFGITDEVFAVGMQQDHLVTASYLAGLIALPYLGWNLGTLMGSTTTGLLPLALQSALGIAIYGMFIAIIIPPARHCKPIAIVILISLLLSCFFRWMPGFGWLSSGWTIILCAVAASAFAAMRYPVDESDEGDVD